MTSVLTVHGSRSVLERADGRVSTLELEHDGDAPDVVDGMVAGMLPAVMRVGGTLQVRGAMTRGAVRNLTEYAEAWASWDPDRFHRIRIEAATVVDGRRAASDHTAIVAWSGGLRSAHTLVRHLDGLVPAPFTVRAVLHVAGFAPDVTLPAFDVPSIVVRTNAVAAGLVDPEIGVLPIVAAALHAVGAGCTVGLHARRWLFTAQQRYPRPEPVLPDLLCGDGFVVRADGGTTSPPRMLADVRRHPALAAAIVAPTRGAFRDPIAAADAEATLADWPGGPGRRRLSTRVALDRAVTDARDTLRWLGSATHLRRPWPR